MPQESPLQPTQNLSLAAQNLPTVSTSSAFSASSASHSGALAYDEEAANSEDESLDRPGNMAEQAELEKRFLEKLTSRGLHIRRMAEDGNCLFRCVSDRVYGDQEMHDVVRRQCLDHMEKERDHFSQYVTQDYDAYIRRKRRDRIFGNHLEIQAMSEIFNRPIHVFDAQGDGETPMNTFASAAEGEGQSGTPLRLSYHGRSHYNVIVDPTRADVGEGLGLPGFEPGLADRMQVESALGASESDAIESELLIAAKDASDMIATQDALLEAVLKASAEEAQGSWQPAPWQSAPSAGQSAAHSEAQPAVRQQPALWQQQQQASSLQEWADRQADTPGSRGTASVGDEHEHAHAAPPVVVGGSGEGLSEVVQQLIAMGFPLGRAVQVHAQFGDDLDSMLECLTND